MRYFLLIHESCFQTPGPGKKGKASPGKPGKGGAPPIEAPPTETSAKTHVETPEQLAQRQRVCHLYKEHKAAIEKEGNSLHMKLLSIQRVLLTWIFCMYHRESSQTEIGVN